jgi:hypothetical protein
MPLNRDEIREDKYFDMLTEAILERDQPRTTDLFFRMTRDGHSVGDALSVVTAAEAPFVQVPSHINVRDGQITLINNDHTILGLRAAAYLMPYLPEKYRLLPLLQSVWYIPAGLDIWNLMEADVDTVWDSLTAHLKNGKSIRSLGDAIQIGAAELILRTTVPRQFTNGQHPFDYCNVANNWFRTSSNPNQPRVLYLMANFINDVAHENKLQNPVIEQEATGIDTGGRSPDTLLRDLDEVIMALDFTRATALASAYLQSGADRKAYQSTVALAACRFQDDPHNQKITISTFEEYAHNSTHLRDRLLLATARLLAGWVKMPGERDCYARFEKDWICN